MACDEFVHDARKAKLVGVADENGGGVAVQRSTIPAGLTAISAVAYTRIRLHFANGAFSSQLQASSCTSGRLAQLVRAPALQAGGPRFESETAHQHLISNP